MKTVKLLIPRAALGLMAAALLLGGRASASGDHQWVGVAKCKTCHKKELIGDQHRIWREGPHHRAFETLKSEASAEIAKERGLGMPATESAECLRCHVSAYGVPPILVANLLELEDGVQCESCHGPGRDYRKKKIMSDPEVAHSKGLWDAANDDAICATCHNRESPTYDEQRYVLPDGTTTGFDFTIAKTRVPHAIPEDVKGHFIELEKAQKEAEKAAAVR